MIAKQYKKGTRTGVEKDKNGFGTGSRTDLEGVKTRLERGQKQVLNGTKNGISPDSTIWNGMERLFFTVPHLSSLLFAVPPLFSPVFDDFRQKWEKKVVKKWRNGKGKKSVLSNFFPIPVFCLSFPGTSLDETNQGRFHWLYHSPRRELALVLTLSITLFVFFFFYVFTSQTQQTPP